jgi:predicted MFS family arabinose efflux permease
MSPPLEFSDKPPIWTRGFVLLFVSGFFFGMSFWPYVLLPVYLQDLGANLPTVGILMGIAPLAGILVRPLVGTALDRLGRRKCLTAGGLIFVATNLLYLGVASINPLLIAVRLIHGVAMGILMATFFTLAADLSPEARRTEGIAVYGISGHVSGTIGVMMGEAIIGWRGYPALFLVCASLSLASLLLSLPVPDPGHHRNRRASRGFFHLAMNPTLRAPLAATVGFALSLSSYMVFLKPYAVSAGIHSVTGFFVAYTLAAVGFRLVGGGWPDRFGFRRLLYPAMVSMSLGLVCLAAFPTAAGLIAAGVLCGTGHGFIFPILSAMMIAGSGHERRGTLMTLFTMLFDFGLFVGAPFLGFIAEVGHYGTMYAVAACIPIASLAAVAVSASAGMTESVRGENALP